MRSTLDSLKLGPAAITRSDAVSGASHECVSDRGPHHPDAKERDHNG